MLHLGIGEVFDFPLLLWSSVADSLFSERTLSRTSWAISRQVVHFPPATKVTPVSGFVEMT